MTTWPELRRIPQQPNHHISKCGRIFFCNPDNGEWSEKIGGRRVREGYVRVRFHKRQENGTKKKQEHRLHLMILSAWVGTCPEGHEGMHKDDNPGHNHLDNLEWGTRSNNMQTRANFGRGKRGPNRPWSEKVEIASYHPEMSMRQLAKKYNLHIGTICKIIHQVRNCPLQKKPPTIR